MDIVRREHIVGHIALVDIYVRPLSTLRLVAGYGVCVFYLMETDAERQVDAKAMFRAIALYAAAIVEEVLQAWLYEETDMRRYVVLDADTYGGRPLERYAEFFLLVIGVRAIDNVIHVESAMYWQFHHHTC